MAIKKRIVLLALLFPFIGISAERYIWFTKQNGEKLKVGYDPSQGYMASLSPFSTAVTLKTLSDYLSNSPMEKRIKDGARRGKMYSFFQYQQKYRYISGVDEDNLKWDANKTGLESMGQQVGYVLADAIVSEAADQVAQFDSIKNIIESKPLQYISDNISSNNKEFFKDQAILVTSAALINGTYQLSQWDKNKRVSPVEASLYYDQKGGMLGAIPGVVAMNSLDHFVVSKYVSKEYSPFISYGLYNWVVLPIVEGFFEKK